MTYATVKCRHCGVEFRFPKEYGRVLYCSALCRINDTNCGGEQYKGVVKPRYYSKQRRKIMAAGDRIDPYVVYVAHNWTCCICGKGIDPELRLPSPWAATLEHIIPLSAKDSPGHVWSNCAPAHAFCNFSKGAQVDNILQPSVTCD